MPPKKIPAPSITTTSRDARGPVKSKSQYPSERPGRARRGEHPSLEAGKSRAMRPAEREWQNQDRMARQGSTNDGRSPVRGRGVYGTSEPNEPTAAQLREPSRRPQRRRGDGSLIPPEVGE
jgi:hypothetical protein